MTNNSVQTNGIPCGTILGRPKPVTPPKNPKRCRVSAVRGDLSKPCFGLSIALNPAYSKAGVALRFLTNLDTNKTRHVAMVFSGNHRKKGLCLNYCPFCGTKLPHTPRRAAAKPAVN